MKQWIMRESQSRELPVDALVEIDQLRLFYRESVRAVFIGLVVGVMLVWILWVNLYRVESVVWYSVITVISVFTLALFCAYKLTNPSDDVIVRWKIPYLVVLGLWALAWGPGLILAMPKDGLLYQLICFMFLVGMAGCVYTTHYSLSGFSTVVIMVMLVPAIVYVFAQEGSTPKLVGTAGVVYLLFLLRSCFVLSGELKKGFLLTHRLTAAKKDAEDLARTDVLTGMPNRRAFLELAKQMIHQCQRGDQPVAMILLDVDHFKKLNDSLGHAMGDLALKELARVISEATRESDVCARLGGEEFVVLLPNTAFQGGMVAAEKLRRAVGERETWEIGAGHQITVSLGLAWGKNCDTDELLAKADAAMYRAKQSGRNRVCFSRD